MLHKVLCIVCGVLSGVSRCILYVLPIEQSEASFLQVGCESEGRGIGEIFGLRE